MDNTITNRQMVFVLFLTLTAVTIVKIPKTMAETAGTGNWMPLMALSVIFGILASVVARLNRAFPGMTLYDYSRVLVGKIGCYIIAVFYVLYFFMFDVYLCNAMSDLLKSSFLYKTPKWALIAAGIPVFGYMAYHGQATVARIFELYGVVFLMALLGVHLTMLVHGELGNILPLVVPSEVGQAFGAMDKAVIAFLGIEVLTVLPFSQKNKKAPRIAFFTLLLVGAVYVLVVESSIMMVGLYEIQYHEYPLLAAIRQLELKKVEFLRRVDILYLTFGLMGIFVGKSMIYLTIVEYAARLMSRVSRLVIVAAAGTLILGLSLISFEIEGFFGIIKGWLVRAGLIAAGLIPIGLWIVAKVKKHV